MNTKLKRIIAIVAAVAILATMALGAFSYFTDYASSSTRGRAGNLKITLTDATEDLTNGLSIMNPGDSNELKFTVNNVGEKSATVRAVMTVSVLDKDGNPIDMSDNHEYKITDLDGKELQGQFVTTAIDDVMPVAEGGRNTIVYTAPDVVLNGSIETEPGVTERSHTYEYRFVMDVGAGNKWQGSKATVQIEIFAKQDRNTDDVGDNWTDMVERGNNTTPSEPSNPGGTLIGFSITYVTNGGTLPEGAADEYIVGVPVTLLVPTKDGNTFAGWYEDPEFLGAPVTSTDGRDGSKTYYAKWEENTPEEPAPSSYTIIYNTNGGTLPADAATKYTDEAPVTLPEPTKDGSTFAGWYENEDLSGDPVTSTAGSTGDKTYYAKWETINYRDFVVKSDNRTKVGYSGAEGENLVIPATFYEESSNTWYKVVGIGDYAFDDCTGLNSVVIPNTVTSIGYCAFYGCSNLSSVTIPYGVTSLGRSSFIGCTSLTSVTIPGSVTEFGNDAFRDCTGMTSATIENGVTAISSSAFSDCTSLASVSLPSTLTSIGSYAFSTTALTSVTIPEGVTTIGSGAFRYCANLTSVNLPSTLTSVGYGTFAQSGLTSITIPEGVTSIDKSAFFLCRELTSVSLPSTLTSIADAAFQSCGKVSSITIPGSVTTIGKQAFNGCKGITSITIPGSVTTIGEEAFYQCSGLTTVTIENGVTAIAKGAFRDSKVSSITIPGSVNSIGDEAFFQCSGLTSVTIEEGVTSMGVKAFWNCGKITTVTIPSTMTSIGEKAFNVTTIGTVYYGGTEEQWGKITIADGNTTLTNATIHYGS